MGLPYETTFQFNVVEPESGAARLNSVVQFLKDGLSAGSAQATSEVEVEAGDFGGYAYAMVKTERPHPQLTDHLMQLEVRLCAEADGAIQANFRSRFVSGDGVDPPELRAGPPRLLLSAAEQFNFSAEGVSFSQDVSVVDAQSVQDFVDKWVFEADQGLPLLVCSERPNGTIPLEPELIQRELIGLARVVRLKDEANEGFRKLTGLPCFNGAGRWIRPGPPPRHGGRPISTYLPQASLTAVDALYNLQQTALQQTLNNAFDSHYSMCRAEVIFERNRELEAERQSAPAAEPVAASQKEALKERRRANEFNRQLGIEQRKVAQLNQQLAEAFSRIEELETELDAEIDAEVSHESPRDRRDEIRALKDRLSKNETTIIDLNGQLQQYRQEDRYRIAVNGLTLPLRNLHPGWLTICNHALNVYRDPMRRFVIRRLQEAHGDDLERCVKSCVDFTGRKAYNPQDPESSIDVGDFEDLVQSNRHCFTDDELQAQLLGHIRSFRNRVSHPPTNGLDEDLVHDGLRNIRDVLECIGEADAAGEVSNLTRLMSSS